MFGDDINSTPISKLTMPPAMTVTSKADTPGGPLAPPVYSPTLPPPQQQQQQPQQQFHDERRVSFDDVDYVREIPSRRKRHLPPQHRWDPRGSTPAPPPAPKSKKKRVLRLLSAYAHPLAVFALVLILTWYLPAVAQWPYLGSQYGGLSVVGCLAAAAAVALAYGIVESIVD